LAINRVKGKRILITAGPTWVAIDPVRVISNIATGETGILLAEKLQQLGARVTLLLGPVSESSLKGKIRLIRYKFFNELKEKIVQELSSHKYDAVIHSAAVSDYQPRNFYSHKVKSGLKNFQIPLRPTEKIINLIRKVSPVLVIVGFKFQPQAKRAMLLREAEKLMQQAGLDLVVANTVANGRYQAYIIDSFRNATSIFTAKESLVKGLIKSIDTLIR